MARSKVSLTLVQHGPGAPGLGGPGPITREYCTSIMVRAQPYASRRHARPTPKVTPRVLK